MNVDKTELVLFKPLRKKLDENVTIKLKGKKLDLSSSVKYLGIRIDFNLNWKGHVNTIAIKLNRANKLLSKLRHIVNQTTLNSIYYAIFESNFNYASIVWAQKIISPHRIKKNCRRKLFVSLTFRIDLLTQIHCFITP